MNRKGALRVGPAYDHVANDYDGRLQESDWIRDMLWARYDAAFRPGDAVLDLGCGTGNDTIHLAKRGVRVTAIDASAGMLQELDQKLRESPGLPVRAIQGDLADLHDLRPASLDGAVSAFAALNTVESLRAAAAEIARVVKPGGTVLIHVLSRFPARDLVADLARGRGDAMLSALSARREVRLGGSRVPHGLYTTRELRRAFAPEFVAVDAQAVAIVRGGRLERALPPKGRAALGWAEGAISSLPGVRNLGRFVLVQFTRRTLN